MGPGRMIITQPQGSQCSDDLLTHVEKKTDQISPAEKEPCVTKILLKYSGYTGFDCPSEVEYEVTC